MRVGPGALILDARRRPSLVAVRALGREGVEVAAADWDAAAPTFVSRWCTRSALLPDVDDDREAHVERLIELCRSLGSPVVIGCYDGTIEALGARRGELEQVASVALASDEALAMAVDKQSTLDVAQALGISVPPSRTVASVSEVVEVADKFGLPLVVKPRWSWVEQPTGGWRTGPGVAWTAEGAHALIGRLLDHGASPIVQPWLSGSRDAVGIFLANDKVWAKFAVRTGRMCPMVGGSSVVRETVAIPEDIGWMAEALVREISLEGYSEVEFRRDKDGRAFLMEINPRLNAGIEVAVRAGVNIPMLLYEWAAGLPLQPRMRYRTGQRMRWLPGDVSWLLEALASPEHPDAPSRGAAVAIFLRDFFRRSGYDFWDRNDARPALVRARQLFQETLASGLSAHRNHFWISRADASVPVVRDGRAEDGRSHPTPANPEGISLGSEFSDRGGL